MKAISAITLLVLSTPALSEVDMYVEVGENYIFLTRQCAIDGIRVCNCAISDIYPDLNDAMMCWREEGDRIIFSNHKITIEKKLSDVKVNVTEPSVSSSPRPDTTGQASQELSCEGRQTCSLDPGDVVAGFGCPDLIINACI
jgi:hypothetical protein